MFSIFSNDSPFSVEFEAVDDIFQPGKTVNGFLIGEAIHRGGMAILYSATKEGIDVPILLKIPRVGKDQPVESLICFETELTILRSLEGPGIPKFLDAGNLIKNPFIAMERIDGVPLEKILQQEKQLPLEQIITIGANFARAIQSIHAQEVIHLDLKPDNILITPNFEVVLIDFGLAHHSRFPDLLAEEMRKGIGSAPYISPEQLVGVRNDTRSDIYAFGVILYEMLTGELPFGNPQGMAGLKKRFWAEPSPPRAIRPNTPPWLQEIILRCLAPFAKDRYQTASQIRQLLRDPEGIKLTERSERTTPLSVLANLKRWIRVAGYEPSPILRSEIIYQQAPLMVVAIDTREQNEPLYERLRWAAKNIIRVFPEGKITCVSIISNTPTFEGEKEIDSASGMVRGHFIHLMEWAKPIELPPEKISYHVLESPDPGSKIVEFAKDNEASMILIGAGKTVPNRVVPWRSTMTKVVEEAHCTVHVVRY